MRGSRWLPALPLLALAALALFLALPFLATPSLDAKERPASAAAASAEEELWYVVELLGERSGYFHRSVRQVLDGGRPVVQIREVLRNELTRLNSGMTETVAVTSRTLRQETPTGETLWIENEIDQGGGPLTTRLSVDGEAALVETTGASGVRRQEIPWRDDVMSPRVAEETLESLIRGERQRVEYRVFSFEAGNVLLEMEARVLERREDGTVVVEQDLGALGTKTREIYDADARLLRQEVGPVVLRLASREEALAPLEASLSAFERFTVLLDRRLDQPRKLRRAGYRLLPRPGAESLSLDQVFAVDGRQTFDREGDREILRVEVPPEPWRDSRKEADGKEGRGEKERGIDEPAYLRPSSLIESDDPEIIQIARKQAGSLEDPLAAARRLEKWVHRNVGFRGAGIGLGTARQTLDSRDGDCTENAFLLAALLRAVEIPSRIVVGLVSAGSAEGRTTFVPHAWVEAWVGSGWIGLDSAVYGPRVDAAHLSMAKSAGGEEGALVQMTAPLLAGFGKFDLEWVEPPPENQEEP